MITSGFQSISWVPDKHTILREQSDKVIQTNTLDEQMAGAGGGGGWFLLVSPCLSLDTRLMCTHALANQKCNHCVFSRCVCTVNEREEERERNTAMRQSCFSCTSRVSRLFSTDTPSEREGACTALQHESVHAHCEAQDGHSHTQTAPYTIGWHGQKLPLLRSSLICSNCRERTRKQLLLSAPLSLSQKVFSSPPCITIYLHRVLRSLHSSVLLSYSESKWCEYQKNEIHWRQSCDHSSWMGRLQRPIGFLAAGSHA